MDGWMFQSKIPSKKIQCGGRQDAFLMALDSWQVFSTIFSHLLHLSFCPSPPRELGIVQSET